MNYDEFLKLKPYEADREEKQRVLTSVISELTSFHMKNCREYNDFMSANGYSAESVKAIDSYEKLPFLPVRAFKEFSLRSVNEDNVIKTMTSSGTTGQQVSKIYLDKETSANQTKVMTNIVSDFIGTKRLPMIILDTSKVIKERAMFSARGAGILGFSIFGRDKIYAFDENMELDVQGISEFLNKHKDEDIFLFGFTFMIWEHFYKKLKELQSADKSKETNGKNNSVANAKYLLDLSHGIMIHGGGWKKLQSEAVSPEQFKVSLKSVCGIERVYNYYGMVEQTGSIYMECECGHLHTSVFSDVIIRNHKDWSIQPHGEKGLIEVVSCLPKSYPGHILLTEDEGIIDGEDDCPCGRKGKYFKILGRIKEAELRGCSDTYADTVSKRARDLDKETNSDIDCGTLGLHNQSSSDKGVVTLCGKYSNCDADINPLVPFDDRIIAYLSLVSEMLLKSKEAKAYPDIVTFGFFCRRANLQKMKRQYTGDIEENTSDGNECSFIQNRLKNRIGRGLIFHIAPSNVPVNFAYSLISAFLAGNVSIVKASSKDFPQTRIICNALNQAFDEIEKNGFIEGIESDQELRHEIRRFINVIMYDRNNQSITEDLSSKCNIRVIWGGDSTIAKVREAKLPPRSFDITFADRYSMAVINADAVVELADETNKTDTDYSLKRLAQDFYNDTYLTDQNACSSPRLIYWLGNENTVNTAKDLFWAAIYDNIKDRYEIEPITAVNKQMATVKTAITFSDSEIESMLDNRIVRVNINKLADLIPSISAAGGYFLEYSSETLNELIEIVNEKYQTLTYYGIDKEVLVDYVINHHLRGIDRILPIGHSMDFSLIWDGYDLIESMSRVMC